MLHVMAFSESHHAIHNEKYITENKHFIYTRCNRRNVQDLGRVFLRSNYTDITQNTYIQS